MDKRSEKGTLIASVRGTQFDIKKNKYKRTGEN